MLFIFKIGGKIVSEECGRPRGNGDNMSSGKKKKKHGNKKNNAKNRPSPAAKKTAAPAEESSLRAPEKIPEEIPEITVPVPAAEETAAGNAAPEETVPEEVASEEAVPTLDERLRDLRPDDIRDGGTAPRRKKGGALSLIAFILCVAVSAVTLFLLARNLYAKYKGQLIYDEIADIFDIGMRGDSDGPSKAKTSPATLTMDEIIKNNSEGKSGLDGEHSEELSRLRATLTSLKKANPDTYGWIKVEGTNIDYPVVKRGDNEYYLDHAYTGEYLPVGAIFADFRTSDTFSENLNLVIYGHNVNTGSMFGSLKEFLNKDVFYNNRITVYTMDGIFTYRPFCIHETPYDSGFINTAFDSWDGYVGFLNELAADSKIKAPDGVTLNENTRILTLSTCTNGAADNRLALHAVLESSVTD